MKTSSDTGRSPEARSGEPYTRAAGACERNPSGSRLPERSALGADALALVLPVDRLRLGRIEGLLPRPDRGLALRGGHGRRRIEIRLRELRAARPLLLAHHVGVRHRPLSVAVPQNAPSRDAVPAL